jgi:metal-responsive CopG/Arc/MetJ family transcriptional regulator
VVRGGEPADDDQACYHLTIVKTIAISIDESTLRAVDQLARAKGRRSGRSALVRRALQEFVERQRRLEVEARERAILARHRAKLARQARALVREQAKP